MMCHSISGWQKMGLLRPDRIEDMLIEDIVGHGPSGVGLYLLKACLKLRLRNRVFKSKKVFVQQFHF
jgi:hypothetical protein